MCSGLAHTKMIAVETKAVTLLAAEKAKVATSVARQWFGNMAMARIRYLEA